MDDGSYNERLDTLLKKVDAVYESTEKTRRYIAIMTWVAIGVTVLPFIGLLFAIPVFLSTFETIGSL